MRAKSVVTCLAGDNRRPLAAQERIDVPSGAIDNDTLIYRAPVNAAAADGLH